MLTGPQRKFCEGIVKGDNGTTSYIKAYPNSSEEAARRSASDLLSKPDIKAEIQRLRDKADEKAGSAVLSLAEKRAFLSRVVRANLANLDTSADGDLLQGYDVDDKGIKLRLSSKIDAIKLDNDLAGVGSEATANLALSELLKGLRE